MSPEHFFRHDITHLEMHIGRVAHSFEQQEGIRRLYALIQSIDDLRKRESLEFIFFYAVHEVCFTRYNNAPTLQTTFDNKRKTHSILKITKKKMVKQRDITAYEALFSPAWYQSIVPVEFRKSPQIINTRIEEYNELCELIDTKMEK